jgi:hypothetical protein
MMAAATSTHFSTSFMNHEYTAAMITDDEHMMSDEDSNTISASFTMSPTLNPKKKSQPMLKNMGAGYVPANFDVICGRGNTCRNHNGNINFRSIIERHLPNYLNANTKTDKSIVVSRIVAAIRHEGGDFVRQEETTGEWHQVSDRALREKVGQSLRDALHTQYRSSTKAKKRRKKVENVQQHEDVTTLLGPNSVMAHLAQEVKDETPDYQVSNMFNAANIQILQELKRRLAEATNAQPAPNRQFNQ